LARLPPPASASVSLHSVVGPQQSYCRWSNQCWTNRRRTQSGSLAGSPVTGLGANPNATGSDLCRSETSRGRCPTGSLDSAVVVSAPVSRATPQAGPERRRLTAGYNMAACSRGAATDGSQGCNPWRRIPLPPEPPKGAPETSDAYAGSSPVRMSSGPDWRDTGSRSMRSIFGNEE